MRNSGMPSALFASSGRPPRIPSPGAQGHPAQPGHAASRGEEAQDGKRQVVLVRLWEPVVGQAEEALQPGAVARGPPVLGDDLEGFGREVDEHIDIERERQQDQVGAVHRGQKLGLPRLPEGARLEGERLGLPPRRRQAAQELFTLLSPDYVDRDLHRRTRSSVLKPVSGVPILGPAHSRPIVRSGSISMVGDRSLQDVDGAWSAFMVVNRAEDAARLDGHQTHTKLAPCHALDLRAQVDRRKQLHRNTLRLRRHLFVAHRALLSVLPGAYALRVFPRIWQGRR